MKVMDSGPGPGANRRHNRSYDEDLQRQRGFEDALSCFDSSGVEYSVRLACEKAVQGGCRSCRPSLHHNQFSREPRCACTDRPLPGGFDKTISQPFIVAVMTDLFDLHPTDTVLEIGTGLGCQTAILAALAQHVHESKGNHITTMEIARKLLDFCKQGKNMEAQAASLGSVSVSLLQVCYK